VATSALREESWEADQLCLSVAAAKRETAAAELAAAEAQTRLTGKAFSTI
jgi:outer membrane murein-binding lipoprotein Lpp